MSFFTTTTTSPAAPAALRPARLTGRDGFVVLDGESYYRIDAFDRLPPFLMSIASETDLWMFVSSRGGLTAGRRDANGALFPYETVDKLHDAHFHTGPLTLLRVHRDGGRDLLWTPFDGRDDDPACERRLYKNLLGNRLVFEEVRHDIGLAFRARWAACDPFGWVRTATLENIGARTRVVSVLDGLRNLLPFGAPLSLYQTASCLVDAYKRADVDGATSLAVYSLTAQIIDRAEPAESLRATTVWSHGLGGFTVSVSLDAVEAFRLGAPVTGNSHAAGQRGHYFVSTTGALEPRARTSWHLVADTGRDHADIAALRRRLLDERTLGPALDAALAEANAALLQTLASADGVQTTGDDVVAAHHMANVLFNNMRGGVFERNHDVPGADVRAFVAERNAVVAARHEATLRALPASLPVGDLLAQARATGDAQFERLAFEYLPLHFGRRHGDPSRPWNRFEIRTRAADGSRALHYEGNWRDIFQNWEALATSFPRFLPQFIAKFVNASTVDGFNPYRLTRDGIDWEVADPGDPWSHIGYWGDHQIVYLLKFLEALERTDPAALDAQLGRAVFSYADVPYRLKSYEAIVADPYDTIEYDTAHAAAVAARAATVGGDGRLVPGGDGEPHLATLFEKLLVPALAKLSNLVPGAGIWMNTQRPEWNDANNALVGGGVSVVTLCYLRRYLQFVDTLATRQGEAAMAVSADVVLWLRRLHAIFEETRPRLATHDVGDAPRRQMLDALGRAFEAYRGEVYAHGLGDAQPLPAADVAAFCRSALAHVDHAIRANRRDDGLYHSYNLLTLHDDGRATVQRLDEMLEGQVAALSSGVVEPAEAAHLVWQLYDSRLYRADQDSFLLYPEKELPSFFDRNVAPAAMAEGIALVGALLAADDRSVLTRDADGVYRFAAELRNGRDLDAALTRLAATPQWSESVARDRAAVAALYEATFHHRAFTGRSGTMYAYEGLGSIYWHMVSKLLLAVQEVTLRAIDEEAAPAVCESLRRAYFRVRGGLGFAKTAAQYGAFPADPYSHTPRQSGAQQPGMTGQVKEEILTRLGELGVRVADGCVAFRPRLLRRAELRRAPGVWNSYAVDGTPVRMDVPEGTLTFSVCGTPVRYHLRAERASVRVLMRDGRVREFAGETLPAEYASTLLDRSGEIAHIDVGVLERVLLRD